MNIAEHIDRGAQEHPERPALLFEGMQISYRECAQRSAQAAEVFAAAGLGAGDRIALFLPNVPDFVVAYLGALKIGALAVSVNSGFKNDQTRYILEDCGARAVVTCAELREHIPSVSVKCVYTAGEDFDELLNAAPGEMAARVMMPEDPAAIVYTSGTTGLPKGATLSHSNVVRNAEAKRHYLGIKSDDRGLLFLPLYHCFGQNAVLNALLQAGATVVLHRRFELGAVVRSIAADRVTMFFGVPTTYRLLLEPVNPEAMLGVRYYFSAAAPLPVEIEERWEEKFGAHIFQGYGLTESSPFASYNHVHSYRRGSIGAPIDGVEMRIEDLGSGKVLPPGESGEIVIRGHNVMLGYWNRPAETAKIIRDGWLHTGDVGRVDGEGYFYIRDRLDDMINSGGVNIYPAEIESVLYAHADVAEAAVYGVQNPLLGQRVLADVVVKPGSRLSPHELRVFCGSRLAACKIPATFHFVDEIPKNGAGKILKRELRERAVAEQRLGRGGGRRHVSQREAELWTRDWLRANLTACAAHEPHPRATFADLGMDSILAVRLATDASDWLGSELAVTAAWSFPTIEAFASRLAANECTTERAEAELLRELELLNR